MTDARPARAGETGAWCWRCVLGSLCVRLLIARAVLCILAAGCCLSLCSLWLTKLVIFKTMGLSKGLVTANYYGLVTRAESF